MIKVFDAAVDTEHKINSLKADGIETVIRYISPINMHGEKTIKKSELDALRAAGINVGFVCEGYGGSKNFLHHDITAATGHRDGSACGGYLVGLGAPAGVCVYAAIDTDLGTSQIRNLCFPYFTSFRAALDPRYTLGAYGAGALLAALKSMDPSPIAHTWLSNAMGWNGSRSFKANGNPDIVQSLPHNIAGMDTDPDVLNPNVRDFGFWAAKPLAPPAAGV